MVIQQSRQNLIDYSIATNPQYIPNWHHRVIAHQLQKIAEEGDKDYKILIVTLPPRHGKSQECSIDFPSWYLGKKPDKEIITASYAGELAQSFGGKTREKVDSPAYKLIFPEVSLKEDEKARGRWRTNKGGSYLSVGVGGAITGFGANILLIDDPFKNREEAESDVMREKVWDWFTSTAFTRLSPNGVVVLIMTRWHMDDLAGRILEHPTLSLRTKLIRLPAIADRDDKFRKQGEALWPSRYGKEALTEIKNTIGPYDWQALYQGSPVLTENQEFRPEWMQYRTEQQVSGMSGQRILTVDTAMSKKTQADFTGFCDNLIDQQNYWNIRAWRAKLSPEELVNNLFALHLRNNYDQIGIERTTFTEGLKPYLEAEQRRRNIFLPIVELLHNQVGKEIRIRGLIPRYAAHSIFHVEGHTKDLEEEQFNFPNGMHDDVLDATAYQLQIADSPSYSEVTTSVLDYSI